MTDHIVDVNKKVCPPHWYVIDPIPDDGRPHPTSTGRCQKCGAVEEFSNVASYTANGVWSRGQRDKPKADMWEPTWSVNFSQRTGHARGIGHPQAERGIVRGRG